MNEARDIKLKKYWETMQIYNFSYKKRKLTGHRCRWLITVLL